MEENITINLQACRFCLKVSEDKMTVITANIKINFENLINEEFVEDFQLPQKACKICVNQILEYSHVKNIMKTNYHQLLKAFQVLKPKDEKMHENDIKTEPEDHFDFNDDIQPNELFTADLIIKEESEEDSDSEDSYKPQGKTRRKRESAKSKGRKNQKIIKQKCDDCGKYYQQGRLSKHRAQKHNFQDATSSFICDICGFEANVKRKIMVHLRMHKEKERRKLNEKKKKERLLCQICNKMVLTYLFKHHQKIVHEKPILKICEHCGCTFPNKIRYDNHIRAVHTLERPYKCKYCDSSFYSLNIRNTHTMYQHHSEKQQCPHCNQVFKNKSYLKTHIRYIHEPPKYNCEAEGCGMKFASKYKLRMHQIKHSEARNYKCRLCTCEYKKGGGLRLHIRTAHLKASYKCEIPGCNSSSHRKDFLRAHIRSTHKHLSEQQIQEMFQRLKEIPMPSMSLYHEMVKSMETEKDWDSN